MPESPMIHTLLAVLLTRRDDPVKEEILRPIFGDEWPRRRTFPNTVVDGGRPWSSTASASH